MYFQELPTPVGELQLPRTQLKLNMDTIQSKLTFSTPPTNGFSLLNNSTVRGLVYDSPITLAVDGNDNLHVGLDQSNLQPKLTFSAPPANGFSLLNGSTTVRGITCTSPITLVVDNNSNLKFGIDPIALTDMTVSSNVFTDLSADTIAASTAGKITMVDAIDIEGILSVDTNRKRQLRPCISTTLSFVREVSPRAIFQPTTSAEPLGHSRRMLLPTPFEPEMASLRLSHWAIPSRLPLESLAME